MPLLQRGMRFIGVGLICLFVQWCIIQVALPHLHIFRAGIVAFIVSAQLNFVLSSSITWRDRAMRRPKAGQWMQFNAIVLLVSGLNAGCIWLFTAMSIWQWPALIIANLVSTCITFVLNHFIVFRKVADETLAKPGIFRASLQ